MKNKKLSILPKFKKEIEKNMEYEIHHYPNTSLYTFCLEYNIKNKSEEYMDEIKDMWNNKN